MLWSEITRREILFPEFDDLLIVGQGSPEVPNKVSMATLLNTVNSELWGLSGEFGEHVDDEVIHSNDFWTAYQRLHLWYGSPTWTPGTGQMSWSTNMFLFLPLSSFRITLASSLSPVTLSDSRDLAYIDLTNLPTVAISVVNVESSWPGNTLLSRIDYLPIAYRAGDSLIHDFRV